MHIKIICRNYMACIAVCNGTIQYASSIASVAPLLYTCYQTDSRDAPLS